MINGTPVTSFESSTLEPEVEGSLMYAQMHHYFTGSRRTFLEHYHQCSYVETAYSTMKGKLRHGFRSKSDAENINEALCKVLCHNICCLIRKIARFAYVFQLLGKSAGLWAF